MTSQEMINKRKFNTDEPIRLSESDVEYLMNEFALHIAERAVKDENEFWLGDSSGLINRTCKNILIRIKQLTGEQK